MAITFDTLKFVETLEEAGVERRQASAIAAAVQQTHEVADVATKADLLGLESSTDSKFDLLRKDIALVRSELRGEQILLRWMLGAVLAVTGAIFVKLFWG